MPKLKTNSGAKKRFRITRNGKVIRSSSFARHILESKSPKRKRSLRGTTTCCDEDAARIKKLMPYS